MWWMQILCFCLYFLSLLAEINVTGKKEWSGGKEMCPLAGCSVIYPLFYFCLRFQFFFIIVEATVHKEMRMPMLLSGWRFVMDSGIHFWHFTWSRITLVWFSFCKHTLTYRRKIVVNARCFRIKWEKLPHASNYILSKAYTSEKGLLLENWN